MEVVRLPELPGTEISMTPKRRRIFEALRENQGRHLSAEEIYHLLLREGAKVGLATVYRTLLSLEKLGVITKLRMDNGPAKYQLMPSTKTHHHLVCIGCGRILEVDGSVAKELGQLAKFRNFQVVDQSVNLYGYCSNCIKEKQNQ